MVSDLRDMLAGKSGVMAQWYQRHSVFLALEGVQQGAASTQMPVSRLAALAGRAVDGLLPAVEKESHDDTRAVGLGCLTRWALVLDAIPPKLLQSLKKGLGSGARPTATMFAAAACQLSGCTRLCAQLASLVPDLLTRVELGTKKPNVFHPDAIFSAKVVLEVAATEAAWVDRVDEAFPWHALVDKDSFVFPDGVLAPQFADVPLVGEAAGPLAPHVCTALCQLIALVAKYVADAAGGQRHEGVQPFSDASAFALIQCTVLSSREVRRVALAAALDVCNVVHGAQATLLTALQKVGKRRCQEAPRGIHDIVL